MQTVTFTNARGESIIMDRYGQPYMFDHIEGTSGVPIDIKSTKSPYQDGSSFVDVQLAERAITIKGTIICKSQRQMYEHRRQMSRILNPKLGQGRLVYTNDAKSYAIDVIAEESPMFEDRFVTHQTFIISFVANDPYWRDENQTVKGLKFETGGLTFPLRMPTHFAFSAYRGTFINNGDVETPIEIRYTGPATNPVVENETTGEFIQINQMLTAKDTLIIHTASGDKRVEIVNTDGSRKNVFNWIEPDSTFFQLVMGQNVLRYGSKYDADNRSATVTVYWNNRYIGG